MGMPTRKMREKGYRGLSLRVPHYDSIGPASSGLSRGD